MADSQEFRKRFFTGNFVLLGILVLILAAVYLLSDLLSGGKVDFTADKVYTVSSATKEILGKLKDRVFVTYYSSEELPGFLQNLRRDTKDMFDEFRELSKDKNFEYTIVNPEAKAAEYAEQKVKEYYETEATGKTPEEPTPPQSIEDIFSQRPRPEAAKIKEKRRSLASSLASQQKREVKDVERTLLAEDFKRQYVQKLEQEQIIPFPFQEREASSVKQGKCYSAIEIKYLAKEAEIIPVHYQIENLEYEIASRILKLTTDEKPVVAFFDGKKPAAPSDFNPMNPPPSSDYEQIIRGLRELFDIRDVDLKEGHSIEDLISSVKEERARKASEEKEDEGKKDDSKKDADKSVKPEDLKLLKCFIVAQPDQLESRQVYEINRAVSLGIPTIFLVSRYSMDVSEQGVRKGIPIALLSPGLEDMFRKWGIELGNEFLASNSAGSLEMPTPIGGGLVMMMARPLPVNVAASSDGIDQSSALTNRINHLVFPATTGLKVLQEALKKNSLEAEILARTNKHTWSVKIDPFERLQNPFMKHQGIGASVSQYKEALVGMKSPEEFRDFLEPTPLAVRLRGKLPFIFEGETIPAWKKEEKDKETKDAALKPDKDLRLNAADPDEPGQAGSQASQSPQSPAPSGESAPPKASPSEKGSEKTPAVKAPESSPPQPPLPSTPAPNAATAPPAESGAKASEKPAETKAEAKPVEAGEAKPAAETKPQEAKPEEKPKASVQTVDGNVLVLSSVDMMKDVFLRQQDYQNNINFFRNSIETFGLGDTLLQIRRKQLTERQFYPDTDKKGRYITAFNIGVVPLVVGAIGLAYFLMRRAESGRYERHYMERL